MHIKKVIAWGLTAVLLAVSASGCSCSPADTKPNTSPADVKYSGLFQKDRVIDINIDIGEKDWQSILSDPKSENYHPASVTVEGKTITNVGFRTKGFSSLRSVADSGSDRYSFKVKMNEYVDGQKFLGLDEFVLNNGFADPSYMREYLTYEALDTLGADTPYRTYANLYINGKLFGFYLCIESLDNSFAKRVSSGNDVDLYEADSENCTLLENSSVNDFNLKYGTDKDLSQIKELIQALCAMKEGQKGSIEQCLNVDSVLKAVAVNTVLGNYDSYNGSKAHNYYLLFDNGIFSFISWDLNMSMGGFTEGGGSGVTVPLGAPVSGVALSERPLIQKLLSVKEYSERYYGYIDELLLYLSKFGDRVESLKKIIRPYVEADPTAFYTASQFEKNLSVSDTDLRAMDSSAHFGGPQQAGPKQGAENRPPQGENGKPQGGMGISSEPVSIMDFVAQRVQNIDDQLMEK